MSTLTLDVGGLDLDVECQKGGHAAPDLVGAVLRSESGVARSFIKAELMNVPVVLVHLDKDTARIIREMFAKGNQIVCNGEVFNNQLADITMWGEITDEMIQGGTWWELSMVLHEVSNGDTGVYEPDTTDITLTGGISGDDPGDSTIYDATPDTPASNPPLCFRALDAESAITCSLPGPCTTLVSLVPERIWLTVPLAAGAITGTPVVGFNSKGINGGSGIVLQSTKAVLYQVRGGIDVADAVAGPFESVYVAGGWGGGFVTLTFTGAVSLTILDGDQLRLELWSRLQLSPGASDPQPYVLARQTICYGGFWSAYLRVGGVVSIL